MSYVRKKFFAFFREDLLAGVVIFLVALPLCLGIAHASGTPLFSGVISGIVGGLVISWASGSRLSVSGPAAGLTVIVFHAVQTLGSFEAFLLSLLISGCIQIFLGYFKAGVIAAFFPTSVIKGMLAAIGLILIIKQIPHALGYDGSFDGDESYMLESASSSIGELNYSLMHIMPASALVSIVALALLLIWDCDPIKRIKGIHWIPAPLIAVAWGIGYNAWAVRFAPSWSIGDKHLVSLATPGSAEQLLKTLHTPDFSHWQNPEIYITAVTIALVASLESLLNTEAVDKLDPHKHSTPANRELKAQGMGNVICSLLGGLPVTALIVRSAANINAGGQTPFASFTHGVLLVISAIYFAEYLNQIPLACLAAILLQIGFKLTHPDLWIVFFRKGRHQFLPFVITVVAILAIDLLEGILIGLGAGIFFILRANFHAAITLTQHGDHYLLRLHKDVSFLNKALVRRHLGSIGNNSVVVIDGSKALFIDDDILETLADFVVGAPERAITVSLEGLSLPERIPSALIQAADST